MSKLFANEADLVAAFIGLIDAYNAQKHRRRTWMMYAESAGFDLLAVADNGVQVGIEAKLVLNAKVLAQALSGVGSSWRSEGPDYRAVLVPEGGTQHDLGALAKHVGINIIRVGDIGYDNRRQYRFTPDLPDEDAAYGIEGWHSWLPENRITLPEYVPDVQGGKPSPLQLTVWKIAAIKLMILLERNGSVTRADMRQLKLSPTRWTDRFHGFLAPGAGGYVRHDGTPDLRAQHPTNYAQIEADFPVWSAALVPTTKEK